MNEELEWHVNFNAVKARELAETHNTVLLPVLTLIKTAASNGSSALELQEELPEHIIKALESRGFKITDYNKRSTGNGRIRHHISW